MPRVDQLLAQSPASVAALKDVLGVDAVVGEVTAIDSRLQSVEESLSTGPTMTLLPTTRTTPEDTQISGNVFSGSSTTIGVLSVMEYSVAGILGKAAAGARINIPNIGSLIIYADGEYSVEFNLNWNGLVPQITFMATNGSEVRLATINITVTAVDDPPVANNNSAMTAVNEAVTFNILANDYDPEGSALILTHVHGVTVAIGTPIPVPNGSVVVDVNRTLTFTPTADYTGLVQFMYTVSDGALSASARVNIQVGFENIPLFSPVQPIDTDDFFDQCAMNFGNTYMGFVGEAYSNGVNVTNATYGTAQGRFDLATQREPWLYDRPSQVYKLYLRTKNPAHRARALEMAQLYMAGVTTINGNEGDFMTGSGGTAQDPKYQYPLIAWWYERETGDMQYRAQAAGMYRLLYRAYPPTYSVERPLWTERNTTYALMGCLTQYWITGDTEALTRAEAYFTMVLGMSEITGAPLHPYNQHEDTGPSTPVSSPWMAGMMVEAFVQLYRTNGDERIVAWIARFCDWVVATGFYVNYDVPEFIGHRIPCYLVGATQQFPDLGGAAADSEHCYDVAIMLQKGIWAKQQLGQDSTTMQQVVYEQLYVADLVFRTWIRATVGLPRYRVNPPRKYGWWFNGAYTTIQSAGVVPMGPLVTALPALAGNSAVGSTLTHTPGTYSNAVTLSRQWCRDGAPIVGQTGLTYTTTVDDVGLPVYCEETAVFNEVATVRRSASFVIATSGSAPAITAQPANATVTAGANATFNFTASGTGLTYSWESRPNSGGSWTTISSALANSYTHTGATLGQSGMQFRGRVTNSGGSAVTDIVTLTVNAAAATAPVVTTHPSSTSVPDGETASFTVAAANYTSLQWQFQTSGGSWVNVGGATALTYDRVVSMADNGGQVRCVATNAQGSTNSNAAALTVTMNIGVDPLEYSVGMDAVTDGLRRAANLFPGGKSYTMQMLVSLDAGPASAWLNGNLIMGVQYTSRMHHVGLNGSLQMGVRNNEFGNTNNFAVAAATWYLVSMTSDSGDNQAGQIRVTFQEYNGESEPTLLSSAMHKGEYFGANNAMQSMCFGGANQFSGAGWPRAMRVQSMRCYSGVRNDTQLRADRHNTDPAGALWWWDAIPGEGGALSIVDRTGNNVVPTLEGTLTLEEGPGDGLGGGGGPGGTAPSFLSQPTDQAVVDGQSFSFIADVDGDPAPTLEWQRNIDGVWTAVGDTDYTFAGTASLAMDGYQYRLVATNGSGSATSNTVTLSVEAAPTGQEFGYSGPSNASVPGSGNRSAGTPYVKSSTGRVNRIAARFVADSASASTARVLCYSVVGGVPTSLLWATAITTVPAVGGLVEFPIPVTGIENTDAAGTYALMMVTSDWPQRLGSATGQAGYTTFISYGSVSIASPPATWPTSDTTYADVAMAVWCEY